MPVTVEEKSDSREMTDGESAELIYIIRGTDSDVTAMSELKTQSPAEYNGMVRGKCRIEPVHIEQGNADKCIWLGTVPYNKSTYTPFEPPETGETAFAFETGGGTQHITQSMSTVGSYAPPGKTAPDFKGAIGVTHDNVEGVDIGVPVFNFSVTWYRASMSSTYIGNLFNLTNKVNDAVFTVTIDGVQVSFAAGEVLFRGASGGKRGSGDWEITGRFSASPNRTNLTVGSITGISKKGWEYMWVRYADAEDSAAKAIVKEPVAAYIEKVYEDGNFSVL